MSFSPIPHSQYLDFPQQQQLKLSASLASFSTSPPSALTTFLFTPSSSDFVFYFISARSESYYFQYDGRWGSQDGSVSQGACCQAWRSEFDPQDPQDTSKEPTPEVIFWPPHACFGMQTTTTLPTQINKCSQKRRKSWGHPWAQTFKTFLYLQKQKKRKKRRVREGGEMWKQQEGK